ncbi:hypothetical protein OHT59_10855 [Streptomyces sp. NBC_00243]|uniref:hypothetical protein n=1 Tax=Streptomyces sp. NBC_00243 TaxID=2975688 RepID=UPI002DDA6E30|nr:hypothetical protein [Streptomyces sp. NBC_00243]WRZ18943.1 hypothetical protein OHT59_10855 [Streptomyces sp. NBC_00243]
MNAETTALRVLTWTTKPKGQPPQGPLWEVTRLRDPGERVRTMLAEIARTTAARLGAGHPPLGEQDRRVGLGALLLAAALGGRGQEVPARRLAEATEQRFPSRRAPREARWYDVFARHGVVAPAVLALQSPNGERRAKKPPLPAGDVQLVGAPWEETEPFAETLLRLSPLTAVLHRPPRGRLRAGATAAERETAALLLTHTRGRELLITGLCRWSPDPAVLTWRAELLTLLDEQDPELILDVCTAARLRHGGHWDEQLQRAARNLMLDGPADTSALAVARFWAPLATKRRNGTDLARARPLLKGYEHALQLVHTYGLTRAGAG